MKQTGARRRVTTYRAYIEGEEVEFVYGNQDREHNNVVFVPIQALSQPVGCHEIDGIQSCELTAERTVVEITESREDL